MEKFKPFPDIARFPDEPRLSGLPTRWTSVFSKPGVIEAVSVISEADKLNSGQREKYFRRLKGDLSDDSQKALGQALGLILSGEITDSRSLQIKSDFVLEKSGLSQKKELHFDNPTLDALTESENVSSFLERFSQFIEASKNLSSDVVKKVLISQSRELFMNPKIFYKHINQAIAVDRLLHSDSIDDFETHAFSEYNLRLNELLTRNAETLKAPTDRESLVKWMEILTSNSIYAKTAETFLANWLNVEEIEISVDHLHQLVTAACTTGDLNIIKKMHEITCYDTPAMLFDSVAAINFQQAVASPNKKTRQQFCEIRDCDRVLLGFKGLIARKKHRQIKQVHTAKFLKRSLQNKERYKYGHDDIRSLKSESSQKRAFRRLWPKSSPLDRNDDQLLTDGLLRSWINERVAANHYSRKLKSGKKLVGEIQLPGISKVLKMQLSELTEVFQEALGALSDQLLDRPENLRSLALLVPKDLDQDKLDRINNTTKKLREEIVEGNLRGISKRGDKIHIISSFLRDLKFESLEVFPNGDNGYDLKITVDGKIFSCKSNKNFQLIDVRFGSLLTLPITGSFLEHVIVCHVHELMCSPAEESSNGDSELVKEFYSRRDHQRILSFGEKPSEKQIIKASLDYGVDLVARNEIRLKSGETQLVTWVSAVDRIDMNGQGPVQSYGVRATDELDKIFKNVNIYN